LTQLSQNVAGHFEMWTGEGQVKEVKFCSKAQHEHMYRTKCAFTNTCNCRYCCLETAEIHVSFQLTGRKIAHVTKCINTVHKGVVNYDMACDCKNIVL